MISENIRSKSDSFDVMDFNDNCNSILRRMRKEKEIKLENEFNSIIESADSKRQRILKRVVKSKASAWLNMVPSAKDGFDLSFQQFRDKLAMRYGREPSALPANCDGCGEKFSLQHALDCPFGGLIKIGHNQMRDECSRLTQMAWGNVQVEPMVREVSTKPGKKDKSLQADFSARGIWESQRLCFFDNRIIDADTPGRLNQNTSTESALNTSARLKKVKYMKVCEDLRASFTPLVCTVDGCFHREFEIFKKRTGAKLACKWQKPYSVVLNWVKVRLQFALIRAVDLRIRCTRKKIHAMGFEDGAGLGLFF